MTAKITKYPMQEDVAPVELTPNTNWFLPESMALTFQFNEISDGVFVLVVQFKSKESDTMFSLVTYHQVRSNLKTDKQDLSLFKSAVIAYESFISFFDIDSSISIYDLDHQEIAAFELDDEDEDAEVNAVEIEVDDSDIPETQDMLINPMEIPVNNGM